MEKLQKCRICLVENVCMYRVVNKNLRELYEKLTEVPFVTEDSRPMLACFICCTKLKQCCRFQRKCLEAEEMFSQMMNKDYKPDPSINCGQPSFYNGFMRTSIENINIVNVAQIESIAIKEEFPALRETLDAIIELQEHPIEEVKLKNVANRTPDVRVLATHHSSFGGSLMKIKTEEEYKQALKGQPAAKKPKLDKQRKINLEDAITTNQKKNENNRKLLFVSTIIQNTQKCNNGAQNTASVTSCRFNINRENTNNHVRLSVKEKRFKCHICERCFGKKCHLTRHALIHSGERPFKCDTCERRFYDKCHLTDHIRLHTGEKPFKCEVCQRGFSQKSHLTGHFRIHSGEEPYKCDICQRRFSQQCHLKRHFRTHTGEKPYKCDTCQRCFGNKTHLITHIRIHTGEKPFQCSVCQRGFKQKIHLTNHVCVQAGEEPYQCKICHRSFSLKSALSNHINTHATRTGEEPKHYILGN